MMTVHSQVSRPKSAIGESFEFSFPYRAYEPPEINGPPENRGPDGSAPLGFTVALRPNTGLGFQRVAAANLRAAVAFLVDAAHDAVPMTELSHIIGRLFHAIIPNAGTAISVTLSNTRGVWARSQVDPPDFKIERTAFGAAHILHEDDTLGLYILEIAPHSAIPAHCHRVMRESELILNDGFLQQDQPVQRRNAYAWPFGHVHAYRNPTGQPLRILCIDSPRFMPADEVALTPGFVLVPMAPLNNYLS